MRSLNDWLNQYGASPLQLALQEALAQSCYHTDGVLQILERHREQQQRPVPLHISLAGKALDHPPVTAPSLSGYDRLHTTLDDGTGDTETTTPQTTNTTNTENDHD